MNCKQLNVSGEQFDKLVKKNRSKKAKKARAARERRRFADWMAFLKEKDPGDFSYECILEVLAYKLRRTREHIVEHDIIMGAEKIGREIKQVEDLIARVINEHGYYERIVVPVDKGLQEKYGRIIRTSKKLPNGNVMTSSRHKNATPKDEADASRSMRAAFRRADRARERDLRRAFDLMAKNIFSWWD
jgi:hypothetical protein